MMRYKRRNIDYSFIMAPFYLIGNDELLKSQLINLNYQTDKSFEVVIPDPHYSKRSWLSEFSKTLQYHVVHFPYVVNPNVPKSFDYGIFNNAVLMAHTNKIITFQDWRFCHPELIKILRQMSNFSFVGFEWQILYKDDCSVKNNNHENHTMTISVNEANEMYKEGIFPKILLEESKTYKFNNSCWGHYCIDRSLWLEVNGIDEVVTNTRHYADLDLNARLEEYYLRNNKKVEIPMIKNVMARIMHNKGDYLGGSSINFDFKVNTKHRNCCFVINGLIDGEQPINYTNDKEFMKFTVKNINSGKYKKLYQVDYDADYLNNNNGEFDTDHATIGFECLKCGVISETPYWYKKSPHARIKSLINIGAGKYKLGRDLNHLNILMENKTFEQKVNILNSF
jgi:hypothetical protein